MARTPATRQNLNNPRRFMFWTGMVGALLLGGAMRAPKALHQGAPIIKESEERPTQSAPLNPKSVTTPSQTQRPTHGPLAPKLKKADAVARSAQEVVPETAPGASSASEEPASETTPAMPSSIEGDRTRPNLVKNFSFESGVTGWEPMGGSEITRIGGGFEGSYSLETRGPSKLGVFGVTDATGWVPRTDTAGTRYRASVWVRSARHKGHAVMRIREMVNDAQVGTASYASVSLSPAWQLLALEYVTRTEGSRLDIQVLDEPLAPGEIFQTDNVVVLQVPKPPTRPVKEFPQPMPEGELTLARPVGTLLSI